MLQTYEQMIRPNAIFSAYDHAAVRWWQEYIRMELEREVRVYAFSQEHDRLPLDGETLPDL